MGLHGSLVDEVGAPRDDIDIWHVCFPIPSCII